MILLSLTLFICLMGILKFIVWYRPRTIDYYVVFPYTLALHNGDPTMEENVEGEYMDDLLNRLTKGDKHVNNDIKYFNMRINVNMADVLDYSEWTTSRFEDEKIYANATNVRFKDGSEMILNVNYDQFDFEFNNYLHLVR